MGNETFLEAQVRGRLCPPAVPFKLFVELHKHIQDMQKNTKCTQILIVNTKNHVENVKYILELQQNKCKYSGNAKIVGNTSNTY